MLAEKQWGKTKSLIGWTNISWHAIISCQPVVCIRKMTEKSSFLCESSLDPTCMHCYLYYINSICSGGLMQTPYTEHQRKKIHLTLIFHLCCPKLCFASLVCIWRLNALAGLGSCKSPSCNCPRIIIGKHPSVQVSHWTLWDLFYPLEAATGAMSVVYCQIGTVIHQSIKVRVHAKKYQKLLLFLHLFSWF